MKQAKNNQCIGYWEDSGVDPVYPSNTISKTQQQFRGINDLNTILGRNHPSTIIMPVIEGMMADNSDLPTSLLDAQDKLKRMSDSFELIPSNIREMFENSAHKMLAFLDNPQNKNQAISLGLIKQPDIPVGDPPSGDPKKPVA